MAAEPEKRQEFIELLELNRKMVFKVTNTYCRRQQDRDDLTQEIMGQLWRAFPAYDPARSFSTWMYRIALNVAIAFVRSQNRRQTVSLDDQLHDLADRCGNDPDLDEHIRELYCFIDQLDQLNRALLLLYLEERSDREISEILGITETNVATKIGRLKVQMNRDLNPDKTELERPNGTR